MGVYGRRKMRNFMDGRSLGIAVLITVWCTVVGLVYNSLYPKGIPLVRRNVKAGDTLIVRPVPNRPDTEVVSKAITLEEALKLNESGEALFLDARSRAAYEEAHIKGALSLPEFGFDEAYPSIADFLAPGMHLVVYCQGVDCDESMIVARKLVEMGYRHVDVFLGGMPEWLEAGYPVEKGPGPGGAD